MDNTWVKLYRKIGDNPVMRDPNACQVFLWLLIHVDKRTGACTTGRFMVSEQLGMNPSTFRDTIYRLRDKYKIITTTTTNKYTTISLLNWAKYNKYQNDDNKTTQRDDTSNQPQTSRSDDIKKTHLTTTRRQQDDTKQDIETKDNKTIDKSIKKLGFGNQDINKLIFLLKSKLDLTMLDDSDKVNRQYANLCIRKFGLEKTALLIEATAQSKFWHTKITSFKGLYYNGVKIISSGRGEVRSIDGTKVLDSENARQQRVSIDGAGIPALKEGLVGGS